MSDAAPRRIVLGPSSLSMRDFPFLGQGAETELRDFLARAFSIGEVHSVELDRGRGQARVHYDVVGDLADLWRRLGRAFRPNPEAQLGTDARAPAASGLFLDLPGPVRVTRVGQTLSSFRVRLDAPDRVRIWHPLLRQRPDIGYRLQEELAALPGVRSFHANRLTTQITVRLESGPRAAERLIHAIEGSWPRLLGGIDGPLPIRRLVMIGGLFALSAVATLAFPTLLPVAVVGVALYRAPSLVLALRDLARGRIGLAALHATGLVFFLLTRSPLRSTFTGILTQLWPKLASDRAIAAQRALLAPYRRRARWAWLVLADGEAVEVPAERLAAGDLIVVRRGETVPADGTIERGLVATADAAATVGVPTDKEPGDAIRAGELVIDGEAFVRVERSAEHSAAAVVEALLPHGLFTRLPALDEAEQIANRNAVPTLALAFYTLAARQALRPAQGVIRPDYATAPRLGAQLGAQQAFVEALRGGALFRRPAALDRLARAEIFVLDDSAPLVEQPIEVGRIVTNGVSDTELLAYASVTFQAPHVPDALAQKPNAGRWARRTDSSPIDGTIHRRAGCAWYQDKAGRKIEVASAAYLQKAGRSVPEPGATGARQSVWVLRDGERLGRIDFRHGSPRAARGFVDRLRAASGPSIRVFYLSGNKTASAERLGASLGADVTVGGLDPDEKAVLIQGLGRQVAWIGDGTAPEAAAAIAASDVSLSTAAPSKQDRADALLLGGLDAVVAACTAAREHRANLAADYRLVYGVNLTAVMGALAAGFGGMDAALLSNAGTAAIYARHARRLRALRDEQVLRARMTFEEYSF